MHTSSPSRIFPATRAALFAAAAAFAATLPLPLAAQTARPASPGTTTSRATTAAPRPAARPAAARPAAAPTIKAGTQPEAPKPAVGLRIGTVLYDVNNPLDKDARDPQRWTVVGTEIRRYTRTGTSVMLESRKLADVTAIAWPADPKQMEQAIIAYQRGDASTALALIQDVINFFEKMKKETPGSLWLKAASIKLDALMVLKNDIVLSNFIRELEAVDSSAIPGLADRLKLAKLTQTARRGNTRQTLAEADAFIKETTSNDVLAQAHLLKGEALLTERRAEDALNAFLRVSVFYGSPPKHIPAAQLGAAKAFRAMNNSTNRALKLDEVANQYLRDIIAQFPNSSEAATALTMLPKEDREATAAKAAEAESAAVAATEKDTTKEDAEEAAAKAAAEAAAKEAAEAERKEKAEAEAEAKKAPAEKDATPGGTENASSAEG